MKKPLGFKRLITKKRESLALLAIALLIVLSTGVYAALNNQSKPGSSNQSQNNPTNASTTSPSKSANTEQSQQSPTASPIQEPKCNIAEQNLILAQLSEQMKSASAYFFSKWEAYTQTQHTADELTFYVRGISTAAYNMASNYRDQANAKLTSINCLPAPSIESYKIFAKPSD